MWNVDPSVMCRKHLLGEHLELHMFVGAMLKGKNIFGYVRKGLVEVHNIPKRHQELVVELGKRGYNHKSPIPDPWPIGLRAGIVNIEANKQELYRRCKDCRRLQKWGLKW